MATVAEDAGCVEGGATHATDAALGTASVFGLGRHIGPSGARPRGETTIGIAPVAAADFIR